MSRPPNREFQEWWNKQRATDHDLLEDKSDGSSRSFLTVDIQTVPSDRELVEKERARSARRLSWVCLLRLQQIASALAWLSNGFLSLLRTANRRIASPDSLSDSKSSRLYRVIKVFLFVVLLLLVFELVAYFKGWRFSPPTARADEYGMIGLAYAKWLEVRADYLAPPLHGLTNMCIVIVLFLVQSIDRVILILGCCWIIFRRLIPVASMEYPTNAKNDDVNVEDYPMVLVQIPMRNEREVRREKISERMKLLQDLVPGCNKVTVKALMLDEIINYVQSLHRQVEMCQSNNSLAHPMFPLDSSAQAFYGQHTQQNPGIHNNILNVVVSHSTVDPLEPAAPCQNMGMQSPPVNGFSECGSQFPVAFCEDDLHTRETSTSTNPAPKVNETNEDSTQIHNTKTKRKRGKPNEGEGNGNGTVKVVEDSKGGTSNGGDEKLTKSNSSKPPEPPRDYLHVRARRGQATDSHSLAERVRREKISERMKLLQDLVPGCNKITGKALMLDEIINYVQSLQRQVEFLSMKLASVNTRLDFNFDNLISKDMVQSNNSLAHPMFPLDSSAQAFYGQDTQQNPGIHNNILNGVVSHSTVDPLEPAAQCQNMGIQLPPLNGLSECGSQFPVAFCEDDLHTIVQMGFGQSGQGKSSPSHSQNFNGSNQVTDLKVEP